MNTQAVQFWISFLGPIAFAFVAWGIKSKMAEGQSAIEKFIIEGQRKTQQEIIEGQRKTQEEISGLRLDLERKIGDAHTASAGAEIRHFDIDRRVNKLEAIHEMLVRMLERIVPQHRGGVT